MTDPTEKQTPADLGIKLPMQFGAYELIEEIGRGGAGVVFKARQPVLNRMCAVKMLLHGRFAGAASEAVLHVEATAAASLDHPNIVGVYEAGVAEGHRFFSMEFVEGRTLAQFVREEMLSAQRIATHVQTIARAIHYAHGRGVLHRDLKPTNVIIDPHDQPQITDFGLTKGIHEPDKTDKGAGSPNFMAPEQASAKFGDTGIHTDVFGIGSILYFMLTDRPPFRGETLADTLNAVVNSEPVRPRQLRTGVPQDLETICLKCLEKQQAKRYSSALEVAEELERFLKDEPLHARPVSRLERGTRWCRRHPALAGFATTTVVLLLALAVVGPTMAYRIRAQRDFTLRNLYAADMALAYQAVLTGGDRQVREILKQYEPGKTSGIDLRGWEWHHLEHRTRDQSLAVIGRHETTPSILRLLPNGKQCLVSDFGGKLTLWDISERRALWSRAVRTNGQSLFTLSADGRTAVAVDRAASSTNTYIKFFETESGELKQTLTFPQIVLPFHLGSDSNLWLLSGNRLQMIETGLGRIRADAVLPTNAFDTAIQLSPDGRWLAAGLVDNSLWISPVPIQDRPRRIPDIQDLAEFPLVSMNSLDFSPDSTLFAVGCHDGNVTIWETRTGKRIARIHAHPDLVLSMSFSEDNRLLATVGRDQRVCVWQLPGGGLVAEKRANHNLARSVAFLPGARELVTSADDQTIRLWSTTPATPHFGQFTNLPPNLLGAFTIPDGEHLSVLQHNGAGGILEIKTGRVTETWSGEAPTLAAAGMSARDGRLVSARVTKSGRVETVPFGGGNGHHWQITNWVQSGSLSGVSIELSRNLQHLAISDMMNGIRVWRIEDQATVAQLQNPGFHALALAPSKPWLAYVSRVAPPRIHDFQTHRDWSLSVPVGLCQACLFTQDERFFLTASLDGTVHVFDPQTGRELNKLRSRTPGLIALNATPDGSRIFAGSVDGFVTIWDPQAGREVAMFRAHTKPIMGMEFLTDGRLMTGAADGVRFWAGAPGR